MSKSQWNPLIFWTGAVLIIILATVFYQPAAAKSGALLVWMNNRVYVMDIDSLILERVGPAEAHDTIAPSPGCPGQVEAACWVLVADSIYNIDRLSPGRSASVNTLPIGADYRWLDPAVSWSPDGEHLAFSVLREVSNQSELRVYNTATTETRVVAQQVDPAIAPAWTPGCTAGLAALDCELAFKAQTINYGGDHTPLHLVAYNFATGEQRQWEIPGDTIFELRWGPANKLLYSNPKRHFRYAEDYSPAFDLPAASKLANTSPNGVYAVYYQPFALRDCQSEGTEDSCLHLGVWLTQNDDDDEDPRLIYSVDLSESRGSGLNFIPTWSPHNDAFVFIQEGNLVHYDLQTQEGTIWYKSLHGKLRSVPIFSPSGDAVAFVDNQGQGYSEYRLVVVDPRLQPIEHIIETKTGFRVLAWLPR